MKTLCVCVLIMVIPLIGGCTEPINSGDPVIVHTISGLPHTVIDYYIYNQTLLAIERKLEEIEKDVKKTLDVAGKKTPISGDKGIRLKLEEIDVKLSDVRTALEVVSRKIPISGDIVQIITYLRPKLNVEVDPNVLCSDKKIRMTFNITNRGEPSVSIGDLELALSTERIRGKYATAETLSPDVDYVLQWESGDFYAAPGQTIKRIVDIEIREDEFEGRPLFYSLCVYTETEPEIVEVLSDLLLDSLETDKLDSISHASFTLTGEISPSAFCDPE